MKYANPVAKLTILLVLMSAASSCNTIIAEPTASFNPTSITLPTITSSPKSILIVTTEIHQIMPTATDSAIPTVFGTPLPDYETIPIPGDAVAGMQVDNQYQFTSRQAPIDVIDHYQQVLPQLGWEIQDVSTMEFKDKDVTFICRTLSQTDGPLQAGLCASKEPSDGLTYVRITVYITN